MSLKSNIADIHTRIDDACKRAGRENDVTLICVSKTIPAEMINEASSLGERVLKIVLKKLRKSYSSTL